jgi:GNAT superfamily N-acetyltransferase
MQRKASGHRPSGLERLKIGAQTAFVFDPAGRILRVNAPDHPTPPRFVISGCAEGNLFHLRYDVSDRVARMIGELAGAEPPLAKRESVPAHMAKYVALLKEDGPVARQETELGYDLPNNLGYAHDFRIVRSGTEQGDALYSDLARNGVPEGLREIGFKDEKEFWEPWCVAFHDSELAAVAFAARLGEKTAAAGVATAKAFRGRGLAAAATAAWTWHPRLSDLMLSYSHNRENRSSWRVTERLGLHFFGVHAAIY